MNNCTFSGRLGRPAELRYTASGAAVLSFPLAVDVGWGERKRTLWVRCSLWGKRAEGRLVDYLAKGAQVIVSGAIDLREYDKRDGSRGFAIELTVRDLDLVGGHGRSEAAGGAHEVGAAGDSAQGGSADQLPAPAGDSADFFEDDIPF